MLVRRKDTQAIPILATANIHTPIPPVELHLRNDHTPSLLPQTTKHTTHSTWYVLSFILRSMFKYLIIVRKAVWQKAYLVPKGCLLFTHWFLLWAIGMRRGDGKRPQSAVLASARGMWSPSLDRWFVRGFFGNHISPPKRLCISP